jgi:hypothetical protein
MHTREIRRLLVIVGMALTAMWICLHTAEAAPPPSPPKKAGEKDPLADGVRAVLTAITNAATRNNDRLSGDRLSEFYVRQAAKTADELPPKVAHKAFLLALGIAIDSKATLRKTPIVGRFFSSFESQRQCDRRLAVLGVPTLRGRHDLAQHFFVSCALSVLIGERQAESAGLLKEIKDSRGKSGFSFADLAADMAGVHFAKSVSGGRLPLDWLVKTFSVERFMPTIDSLEENIAWEDFIKTYGHTTDPRFQSKQASIRKQIKSLPGYSARPQVQR